MIIRCDLVKDLDQIAEKDMLRSGYTWDRNSAHPIFIQYLNLLNREVEPRPRVVHISRGLRCPIEHEEGFSRLIKSFVAGRNVNNYLSSSLLDASYKDGFLDDFGLHHFHLGVGFCDRGKSKGFVKRTGPILIAYVTDAAVYFIGIHGHGVWGEQSLIEVIHNEWPEILEKFKLIGVLPSSELLESKERILLRKKGVNSFVAMPDRTVYASIGGGITCAKTNTQSTLDYQKLKFELRSVLDVLCKHLNRDKKEYFADIKLKLLSFYKGYLFKDVRNEFFYFFITMENGKAHFTKFPVGAFNRDFVRTKGFELRYITKIGFERYRF